MSERPDFSTDNSIKLLAKGYELTFQQATEVVSWIAQLETDLKRLDKLDKLEPSFLMDMIRTNCIDDGKTLREMVDWVYRNCGGQP